MGDLRSRIEVTKLARELGVAEAELSFLTASTPEDLRELRRLTSAALFTRNEDRVKLLAALSRMLPVPLTAKIAEVALGPALSARVAGVLDPREASRLAGLEVVGVGGVGVGQVLDPGLRAPGERPVLSLRRCEDVIVLGVHSVEGEVRVPAVHLLVRVHLVDQRAARHVAVHHDLEGIVVEIRP